MKIYKKSLSVAILCFFMFLGFLALSNNVRAVSNINYTFIDNILYESDSITLDNTFNLGNETLDNGHYNATFSFTNDIIGNEPKGWVSDNDMLSTSTIINEIDGHKKVLRVNDVSPNANEGAYIYQTYDYDIINGTIEFWFRITDGTKKVDIIGSPSTFHLYTSSNKLIATGGGTTDVIDPLVDNQWYHIKLNFSCETDTYDIYIDGYLTVNDKEFEAVANENTAFNVRTDYFNTGQHFSCYIDALGYSWDGYNATYSFTNEIDLEDTAIGYVESVAGDGTLKVIKNLNEHKSVINMTTNTSGFFMYSHSYSNKNSGILEGWFQFNNMTSTIEVILREIGTIVCQLIFQNDNIYIYNGNTQIDVGDCLINTWYHVKMVWRVDNTYDVYINEILLAENFNVRNNMTNGITREFIRTYNEGYSLYIDAIGYSWDAHYNIGDNLKHYTINDNIVPSLNYTSEIEAIYDEFAFDENGVQYDTGWDTEANNWVAPYGGVSLSTAEGQAYDRRLSLVSTTINTKKITKDFNISDGLLKFTLNIEYLAMLNPNSYFLLNISSSLDNAIGLVRIIYEADEFRLQYSTVEDGSNYITLTTIDTTNILKRTLDLFIGEKFCLLTYQDENTPIVSYPFHRFNYDKGLFRVDIISKMIDNDDSQTIILDSIGTYVNGTRLVDDYGIYNIDLEISSWNSERYNLFEIEGFNNFSIGVHTTYNMGNYESIRSIYNYTEIKNYNLYGKDFTINNPSLAFISRESIFINSIKISGVMLTDNTDDYYPNFYYGYVDIDESYFYVDSNNRLQFSLIANDNYTEYIELRFFLLTKTTENRSVSFVSDINGVSQGYLHFKYWGFEMTDIYFPYYLSTTTVFLPQAYIIYTLSIIVSDLDMTWYDDCSGYITNLKLIHTPQGIQGVKLITFDVSTLLVIIIPLIILLTPTLAISVKFGKKAILPMFVLMSLICVATDLIPIWLFFIIAISTGALMFGQYKKGNE